MNRRKFLKALGLGSAGVALGSGMLNSAPNILSRKGSGNGNGPKNLIFLVSDGMSQGTLYLADQYLRWKDKGGAQWIKTIQEGKANRSLMDMSSLNSIVTDSAAAASSWGGGSRVNNGSLNVGPNGEEHLPLWIKAKQAGKRTGLVTTATATHATPAGFAANSARRNDQELIAAQYLERDIDVVLGGGWRMFVGEKQTEQDMLTEYATPVMDRKLDPDKQGLLAAYEAKGYQLVFNRQQLNESQVNEKGKLLGLFSESYIPFDVDRINTPELLEKIPTLREMMRAALKNLSQSDEGFVLLVEGARVDHAAHSNDFAGLIYDQLAFDECIEEAREFCAADGETLLVVTTDHGSANPGLSNGSDGGKLPFQFLDNSKGSYMRIQTELGGESTAEAWKRSIQAVTGVELSKKEMALVKGYLEKTYAPPYARYTNPQNFLGQILANHTQIGWVGNAHTSNYVELFLEGPGSEKLPGFIRNIDLHHYLVEQLRIGPA